VCCCAVLSRRRADRRPGLPVLHGIPLRDGADADSVFSARAMCCQGSPAEPRLSSTSPRAHAPGRRRSRLIFTVFHSSADAVLRSDGLGRRPSQLSLTDELAADYVAVRVVPGCLYVTTQVWTSADERAVSDMSWRYRSDFRRASRPGPPPGNRLVVAATGPRVRLSVIVRESPLTGWLHSRADLQ